MTKYFKKSPLISLFLLITLCTAFWLDSINVTEYISGSRTNFSDTEIIGHTKDLSNLSSVNISTTLDFQSPDLTDNGTKVFADLDSPSITNEHNFSGSEEVITASEKTELSVDFVNSISIFLKNKTFLI